MSFALLIPLSLFALIIQAFFACAEISLISSDRLHLKKQSNSGHLGAKLAIKLLLHPELVLSTTILGTTICVTFQATLLTIFVINRYGHENEFYATLVLSPIVLIFGEILPKTIGQRYSEILAPRLALPMKFAQILFKPANWLLEKYTAKLSKILNPIQEIFMGRSKTSHREDLKYILNYGKKDTALKQSERNMIRRIFEFAKMDAKNSMIPLVNVDMIEDTVSQKEAIEIYHRIGHSRLPVYQERVDNIIGILHMWDVFSETNPDRPIRDLMQKPYYVPVSQMLEDLFFTMKRKGIQMSVVLDEYGGAVGVITVEDILEEIVGEIKDELDNDSLPYKQIAQNKYIIQSNMPIALINELLKFELPKGDYETLSGFLLQQFNRIPDEGDELFYRNLKFVIRKATNRKIESAEVEIIPEG